MKILFAYNNTLATRVAMDRAVEFAKAFNAEITLVYVVQQLSYSIIELPEDYFATATNEILHEAEKMMRSITYRLSAKGVSTKYIISIGAVAESILSVAEKINADLIIVGFEDNNRIARFFNGDISRNISINAKCNVLIAKS